MNGLEVIEASAVLLAVFCICLWREKKPRVLGDVKMFPYVPIMMACMLLVLVLGAHGVTLVLGKPILPLGAEAVPSYRN